MLQESRLSRLRDVFRAFDAGGSGIVGAGELQAMSEAVAELQKVGAPSPAVSVASHPPLL